MNSDQLNPETLSPPSPAPADDATTPPARRSRARRPRSAAPASDVIPGASGPEMTADVTSDTGVPDAPTPSSRRRRRPTTAAREAASTTDDIAPDSAAAALPAGNVGDGAHDDAPTPEIIQPLNAQDALVSEGLTGDAAADAPLSRNRRRRGRGGRTVEPAALVDVDLPLEAVAPPPALDPVEPTLLLDNGLPAATFTADDDGTDTDAAAQGGTGRRRRRRRGGRGSGFDAADAEADAVSSETSSDEDVAAAADVEPFLAATAEPGTPVSPAVRRRFDHMNWRERVGRGQGNAPAAPTPVNAVSSTQLAAAPTSVVPGSTTPPSFERSGRSRFGERQPYAGASGAATSTPQSTTLQAPGAQGAGARDVQAATASGQAAPFTPAAAPTTAPSMALEPPIQAAPPAMAPASPIVTPASPIVTPNMADITPLPAASPAVGGGAEARLIERLERLLQAQSTALQQQGQAIQTLASTMTALQGAIERMATTGIAAGMPRAGMFVDAPNIIYAAENARVNIDYGRMLDFLSRGREMVHAIVYAPVTEDNGYRFDQQRFVAPFMNKGYKMVTKALKRFPDGTAKGNFDIELAIDIVTMSQRLDVIILISGDSDFSRLVELIQSRGVRVEVVSFASNVSWELVQMADVFIDVGQYINEFRAL